MKNPYYPTALGLYFNYLVHGMGVILMSLNMASLETLWQTNAAGRLDSYLITGHWSIKCLAFCRIIIRSLWSPPFYHARDVLLYGLLFWHPAHQ